MGAINKGGTGEIEYTWTYIEWSKLPKRERLKLLSSSCLISSLVLAITSLVVSLKIINLSFIEFIQSIIFAYCSGVSNIVAISTYILFWFIWFLFFYTVKAYRNSLDLITSPNYNNIISCIGNVFVFIPVCIPILWLFAGGFTIPLFLQAITCSFGTFCIGMFLDYCFSTYLAFNISFGLSFVYCWGTWLMGLII